jgi:C4-dicarboxylate-specific signal transduction histidine kinase
VATAVLHNVGNVLNSVNVSATLATDDLRGSKIADVSRAAGLLKEHADDLGLFLTQDPKGRQLPGYLAELGEQLAAERQSVLAELERLSGNILHIKDIVTMQQRHAKSEGVRENVKIAELVEDALRLNAGDLERHRIQLVREYKTHPSPEILVEKHKVLQIFVNLITNANSACADSGRPEKRLTIQVARAGDQVRISFIDNGIGILGENLTRIFTRGFTTRANGHGFGLHSAALAAQDLGGTLQVHSDGLQTGATFTLSLPWSPVTA